ncbi:hypothetical protein A5634_00510 [Mycobacterium asiaticum]|uniref:Heavy metal-binding domain-containing protein n=1 Tax=Mycobacterium asiaticum TaxID=1790 RepID=A0A1A3NHP0_MYCAS|nr:hypothetical protein [Mycobacterium asiaticum]OBK21311.1 hypothetical protein A5634_00510 [Mycobacterium asiaticum]
MRTPAKLAVFCVGLVAVFGASIWVGGMVGPANHGDASRSRTTEHAAEHGTAHGNPVRGVSLSEGDVMLTSVTAPTTVQTQGMLSFRIETLAGVAVTEFDTENTKQMHLIVVRSDGAEYRHEHPTMNTDGRWSIPWAWDTAGTYRIFADFVPSQTGAGTVLSDTVEVGGVFNPRTATNVSRISRVAGFTVSIDGSLQTRTASTLKATISRDGKPVTTLQPYLGSYGHLVVLRAGDLAYLHAHPDGPDARSGSTAGPEISFGTTPPTAGCYLLYLDFQVDGQVHTAQFVVDAGNPSAAHQ